MKLLGGLLLPLHGMPVLHRLPPPLSPSFLSCCPSSLLINTHLYTCVEKNTANQSNWIGYSVTAGIANLTLMCIPIVSETERCQQQYTCMMLRDHTGYNVSVAVNMQI